MSTPGMSIGFGSVLAGFFSPFFARGAGFAPGSALFFSARSGRSRM